MLWKVGDNLANRTWCERWSFPLSILSRAETILVVDGHLHWCGPDAVGSLVALAWALGILGLFFSCARDVGLLLVLFAHPGLWGFCLVVFVGCARMWVLGFVYLVCLVICVGCARMWVIGFCFIRCFLFRADAPFPLFLGEVLFVFRFFWGSF